MDFMIKKIINNYKFKDRERQFHSFNFKSTVGPLTLRVSRHAAADSFYKINSKMLF